MSRHQRHFWTAACSSALLLASIGCSETRTDGAGPPSSGSPAAQSPAASSARPPSSPAAASPTAEPSPPPSSEPATSTAGPAYRMNKVYNIIPIDKAKSPDKVVLLTFDDGPKEAGMIDTILDALDKHHAKAIFFVNGYRVKAHPELLKELHDRGQVIGNHSWDHIELGKEKEAKVRDQIVRVQDIVKEVTGEAPAFFRPPFASGNDAVHKVAGENGLLYMTWSNGSLDWDLGKKVKDKPQAVIDNVMKQLHPGSNILMHELKWTAAGLDRLLTQLEAKGYSFVDPKAIQTDLNS